MARPEEKGIRYFSVDTNMLNDRKIQRVVHPNGSQSIAVIFKLWSLGYEENGYYLAIDTNLVFDIAFSLRLDEGYVSNVILACVEAEIFDKTLWDKYEILTSRRMQENYLIATKKRKNNEIDKRYLIKQEEETEFLQEETPKREEESTQNGENEEETQQSKLKQTKLNKTKLKDDATNNANQQDAREEEDDEDRLMENEIRMLLETFGKITEHTERVYVDLTKKYYWPDIVQALNRTKKMGGQTIEYTRTILNEDYAARA